MFPVPRKPGHNRILWNILDRLHHTGKELTVFWFNRRESHATVTKQSSCDTVPADRGQHRVPGNLGIKVGMNVDKSRRYNVSRRVNFFFAFSDYLADGSNLVSINGNIGAVGFCTRAVYNQTITNH